VVDPSRSAEDARLESEEAFHDRRFETDGGVRPASRFYAITERSVAVMDAKLRAVAPGTRCLELGCGLQTLGWTLLEQGAHVTAIDISQVAVDQSAERAAELGYHDASFLKMNAEDLEFDPGSFDLVVGKGIIHHLDTRRSISEVTRVLVPGGRFLFDEPTGHNPLINLYRHFTPSQRTPDEHPLLREDFRIIRSLCDSVDFEFFHLLSLLALPLAGRSGFHRALERLDRGDEWLFRHLPAAAPYGWMVLIDGRVAG
jgi:SAM-dependent methyltransferase